MTGSQALERAAPNLPVKPGPGERREFGYIRHGAKALVAAFEVATGQVRGTVGDTRADADFGSFLADLQKRVESFIAHFKATMATPLAAWRVPERVGISGAVYDAVPRRFVAAG